MTVAWILGCAACFALGMWAGIKIVILGYNKTLEKALAEGEIEIGGIRFVPANGRTYYHDLATVRKRNLQ